jgi:hypothetical protein
MFPRPNRRNGDGVADCRRQQPVRLGFHALIFNQPVVFFSHINQPTVFSTAYFQPERTSRTWAASSTLPLNPTHQATTSEVVAMLKYRRDDYGDLARTRSEYRRVVSTPAWACPPMCFMSRGRQMQKGFGFCRLLEYS